MFSAPRSEGLGSRSCCQLPAQLFSSGWHASVLAPSWPLAGQPGYHRGQDVCLPLYKVKRLGSFILARRTLLSPRVDRLSTRNASGRVPSFQRLPLPHAENPQAASERRSRRTQHPLVPRADFQRVPRITSRGSPSTSRDTSRQRPCGSPSPGRSSTACSPSPQLSAVGSPAGWQLSRWERGGERCWRESRGPASSAPPRPAPARGAGFRGDMSCPSERGQQSARGCEAAR